MRTCRQQLMRAQFLDWGPATDGTGMKLDRRFWIEQLGAVICGVELDAVICGVELGAMIHGVELFFPTMIFFCHVNRHADATLGQAMELDAVSHGVETSNLDVMKHGVDPLGPKLSLSFPEVQKRIFLKKSQIVKNMDHPLPQLTVDNETYAMIFFFLYVLLLHIFNKADVENA